MKILIRLIKLKDKILKNFHYKKCFIRQMDEEITYEKKNCPGCYMGLFAMFDPYPCKECPYYKYREEIEYCKEDVNTIIESCEKEKKDG